MTDRRQIANHRFQRGQQLVQRSGLIQADIHRALFDFRHLQCLDHHRHQIADIEKVASLLAIAKQGDRRPVQGALAENADDPGIRRGRILARPEDVEEAKHYRFQAMLTAVEVQVLLAGQLVYRVRRQRCLGRIFLDRLAFAVVAINRSAGGKQHALDAVQAHGLADIQGADEVALVGFHRVIHRGLHRGHGGQVHHCLATGSHAFDQLGVGDVAFDQFQTRVIYLEVAWFAGRQVIEDTHGITFGQQRIAQVGTDEASATGDQNRGISHDDRSDPVRAANRRARRGV
ncbi:hypothetical protein D3C79_716540 [compost metagenome]